MPTTGLSIFGIYPSDVAQQYLLKVCKVDDESPDVLVKAWKAARDRLGAAIGNPGAPAMTDMPPDCAPQLQAVDAHGLKARFEADFGQCQVKMVEIRPLLAVQAHVERKRCASQHGLAGATAKQLLETCLPVGPQQTSVTWEQDRNGRGLLIRHPDFNLQSFGGAGTTTPEGAIIVGPVIGIPAQWTQAMEIGGRVYLRNGYHRAVGLMEAGHSYMPCLTFAGHPSQLGVDGFPPEVMAGGNPPTLGHFEAERATEVQLRKLTKMISISWTEFLLPEQD